jgi:excisionase family DNA binding protein
MPTNRITRLSLHDKLVLTVQEACALASIGRTKLYEEVRAGRLAVRKRGSRTLINRTELDRYLESAPRKSVGEKEGNEGKSLGERHL